MWSSEYHSYLGAESTCHLHVNDKALARWINDSGSDGDCDFCGSIKDAVVAVTDLLDRMAACLRDDYEPESTSSNIPFGSDWEIETPTIPSEDLLADLGDPLGSELTEIFINAFPDEWVADGVWSGTREDWLADGWDRFVETVKTRSRFMFHHPSTQSPKWQEFEIGSTEMLDALAEVLRDLGCVVPYPMGQQLTRGRKHHPDKVLTTPEKLGAPPPDLAVGQRMNPPGIPYFYAALDEETALAELRGVDGEVATVADWIVAKNCWIVDLVRFREPPSMFDDHERRLVDSFRFLRRFAQAIREPVRAHDNADVDYVPTQIVAEFIRHCVKSDSGEPISGIMFSSAVRSNGTNLVLFIGPESCGAPDGLVHLLSSPRRFEAESTSTDWNPL